MPDPPGRYIAIERWNGSSWDLLPERYAMRRAASVEIDKLVMRQVRVVRVKKK